MKKILLIFSMLTLMVICLWLVSVGIIGYKTEQYVRQQLQNNSESTEQNPAAIRHTLVSYDSHFVGATAITRLDFGESPISRWLSELEIIHNIQYGPLFRDKTLKTGLSHWQSYVNLANPQEDQSYELQSLFADNEAGLGTTLIDWNQHAHYQLLLNPINYQDAWGNGLQIQSTRVTGQLIPKQPTKWEAHFSQFEWHRAAGSLSSQLLYSSGETSLSPSPQLQILYINAPEMSLLPAGEVDGIRFKPDLKFKINQHQPDMAGELTLLLDEMQGPLTAFNQLYLSANYQGLSTEGVQQLLLLQTRLRHRESQLEWNQELLEIPEGQKNNELIHQEIQQLSEQGVSTLFNQALKPGQSAVDYELQLRGKNGDVYQKSALQYVGTHKTLDLNELFFYQAEDWGRLANGEIQLQMDVAALSEQWQPFLQYALSQKAIVSNNNQYNISLNLQGGQATLNNQAISLAEIPSRFFPQAPLKQRSLESSKLSGIPADIIQQIDQQGLTADIMQQLEESDDVEPEALELLRQLYEMSEQLPQ